mgnify:CR=1 FL=1|jgi:hypothetical protein|tara:strand:- start:691 stop:2241 length:1551 start_codon:yes stop_codon:yes gene_type:complete
MSITYNKQITDLEFSNELGEKNLNEIELQIQQLLQQQDFIKNMKKNNSINLKILKQKKLQEDIDIKFLPFLPKEVNNIIRNKCIDFNYESMNDIYDKMCKDMLCGMSYYTYQAFLIDNIGDYLLNNIGDFEFDTDINISQKYKLWINITTKLQFIQAQYEWKWEGENIRNMKNLEITDDIRNEFITKLLNMFKESFKFCKLQKNIFGDENYMRKHINNFSPYKLEKHFIYWNKCNLLIYLKKNVDKLIKYSIDCEVQILEIVNRQTKHLGKTMSIQDNTKYWIQSYQGEYVEKELFEDIWYGNSSKWNGFVDNNKEEQVKKYVNTFISKKKIPVFNKNGKMSNKTNYKIMGRDIMKYYQTQLYNLVNRYSEDTIGELEQIYCVPRVITWSEWNGKNGSYHKLFTKFYLNGIINENRNLQYNKITDLDLNEMRDINDKFWNGKNENNVRVAELENKFEDYERKKNEIVKGCIIKTKLWNNYSRYYDNKLTYEMGKDCMKYFQDKMDNFVGQVDSDNE